MSLVKVKVRKVGSSLGVLLPKGLTEKENIKEGEEIELSVLKKRNLEAVMKLVGTAKGAKPFVRDRIDRADRS